METLRAMRMFVETIERGSFAAAARARGVGASAVSKQVARLEEELGVRLLHRTTRSLSLTEEGEYYLEECYDILGRVDAARDTVSALADQTRGTLKVSAPPTLGQMWLGSIVNQFRDAHPSISVQVWLSDEILDPVTDSFDVAIRVGELEDSSLIGRRLADNAFCVCAAPSYLERAGRPQSPEDLREHDCITSVRYEPLRYWEFKVDGESTVIDAEGSMSTNSFQLMLKAALNGQGLVRLPLFAVSEHLESGALEPVLEGLVPSEGGIWALYPSRRLLPRRVELFLELMAERSEALSA